MKCFTNYCILYYINMPQLRVIMTYLLTQIYAYNYYHHHPIMYIHKYLLHYTDYYSQPQLTFLILMFKIIIFKIFIHLYIQMYVFFVFFSKVKHNIPLKHFPQVKMIFNYMIFYINDLINYINMNSQLNMQYH